LAIDILVCDKANLGPDPDGAPPTCEGSYDAPDVSAPMQQGIQGSASCPCWVRTTLFYPEPGGKAVALASGQLQWGCGQYPSRVVGKVKERRRALMTRHGAQGVEE